MLTAVLIGFSVLAHELAHGYMALREGDDTAKRAGRLSWNPLKHIHPFASIVLPIVSLALTHGTIVLGGAKPVPVCPIRYRDRAQSDILVSLAGVAANALIALACLALLPVLPALDAVLTRAFYANATLIVFNLLPIAPLDGWRVWRVVRDERSHRAAVARCARG